jgi:23S rRNA pseudouridine2605 synthase
MARADSSVKGGRAKNSAAKAGKGDRADKPDNDDVRKDGEKLQKVLARSGLGSRREMERWIEQGRVSIRGRAAKLGDRVHAGQAIEVDGRPLAAGDAEKTRCLLYHKPTGEVCSRKDPEQRHTVFERLPKVKSGRWISIGRLDYNTSGLLLFTTDGELANALMHPSANIEREYMVRVMGQVTDEMLQAMRDGVMLEDGVARFSDIQAGGGDGVNSWYYVVIMEGRNREVRRLWESQGLTVSRLKRVRYGEIFIPSKTKKGQWQELGPKEVQMLYRMAGMPVKAAAAPTPGDRKQHERLEGKRGRVRVGRADRDGASRRGRSDSSRKSASEGKRGSTGKPGSSNKPASSKKHGSSSRLGRSEVSDKKRQGKSRK